VNGKHCSIISPACGPSSSSERHFLVFLKDLTLPTLRGNSRADTAPLLRKLMSLIFSHGIFNGIIRE
jgi:hypothetical protein